MEKRKICLVIPSLQAGGMERVMSQLARYFASKESIEVHLVLYGISRELFYQIPLNILVHRPDFRFRNNRRTVSTLKTLLFLRRILRQLNPASVLSFGEYWNNFVLLAVLGLKLPVYISDRSQPGKSLGWFQELLRFKLYPNAKGIIFQTEKAKEIFLSHNEHPNTVVIGNPIKSFNGKQQFERRKNKVLMVGRLITTKHQDKLIEIFADINLPDWQLIIVGYDHLKQQNLVRLKELATSLGIKDRIVFTGKQDNLDKIYSESSIFAFTSSSEGFPNAIGEAMAAGLPVVAFDCIAGPSEMIIDQYNGFLIPLFDFEQFKMKLKALMEDESLRQRLGSNARESIKKFDDEKICEAYCSFIL